MKTKNKLKDTEFHAVDFMRKVRRELSEKFLADKEQYMKDLKQSMDDFKLKQKKPSVNSNIPAKFERIQICGDYFNS